MVIDGVVVGLSALVGVVLAGDGQGSNSICVGLAGSGRFVVVIVIVDDYDFFGGLSAEEFVPIDRFVPRAFVGGAI